MSIRFILVFSFFIILIHTILAYTVCSSGNVICERCNSTDCPECHPNGDPISIDACCQQRLALLALTATSIQASAYAIASTQAGISASSKLIVDASGLLSSGSFVSIVESFSLSLNSDRYCNLTTEVAAYIKNYVDISSVAATEIQEIANIVSNASNIANFSYLTASNLLSTAETIINSTCCSFDSQVFDLVTAASQYLGNASVAVSFAQNISSSATECATLAKSAYESVNKTAGSFLNASFNNCCNNTLLSQTANNSLADLNLIIQAATGLVGNIQNGCDQITALIYPLNNAFQLGGTVISSTLNSECANASLLCCSNSSCCTSQASVSGIVYGVSFVLVSSEAISQYYTSLATLTKSKTLVLSAALQNATAGVKAASYASASISINSTACCSVVVSIDSVAVVKAGEVIGAFVATNAAATAVTEITPAFNFLLSGATLGHGHANSLKTIYDSGCCDSVCCNRTSYALLNVSSSLYDCCSITGTLGNSSSYQYAAIGEDLIRQAYNSVRSSSVAASETGAADCTSVIRKATASFKFILNLCCCTSSAPTTITSTKVVSYTSVISKTGKSPSDVSNIISKFLGKG